MVLRSGGTQVQDSRQRHRMSEWHQGDQSPCLLARTMVIHPDGRAISEGRGTVEFGLHNTRTPRISGSGNFRRTMPESQEPMPLKGLPSMNFEPFSSRWALFSFNAAGAKFRKEAYRASRLSGNGTNLGRRRAAEAEHPPRRRTLGILGHRNPIGRSASPIAILKFPFDLQKMQKLVSITMRILGDVLQGWGQSHPWSNHTLHRGPSSISVCSSRGQLRWRSLSARSTDTLQG